jgi:hypothetical protein
VTSIYLQGIDNAEIIDAVHARRPPVIPALRVCAPVHSPKPGPSRRSPFLAAANAPPTTEAGPTLPTATSDRIRPG